MPTIMIDAEQADLIEVAITMLEAALRARSKRIDPGKVISNSLALQGNKLATVRTLLAAGEPPNWSNLDPVLRKKAMLAIEIIINTDGGQAADAAWHQLRGISAAPAFPAA
jgi:hypothetical protein